MKLAHVVNPVKVTQRSDLYTAQPITFESMRLARNFYKKKKIEQFAVFYPEDEEIVPDYFTKLPVLENSTIDKNFKVKRKLPYFREILDKLYEHSDADYFIQTNADIALQPYFYKTVLSLIKSGHESIIINKRIIPAHYKRVEDLPEMYAELGTAHNGYDCFIYPRDKYKQFVLGDICMGTPWSESTLTASMAAFCNLTVLRAAHATFHIGDTRTWLNPDLVDYRIYNVIEFTKTVLKLSKKMPNLLKDSIVRWLIFKMKHELQPNWPEECHRLCEVTTGLR